MVWAQSMSKSVFTTVQNCCVQQACIMLFGRSTCPALIPMQGPCSINLHNGQHQAKAGTGKLTLHCMSKYTVHTGQIEQSHWLQAMFIASLSVQVCLSHTPSHMSDQRAASSRRRGVAGTAVATRPRLSVCSSSVWLYCNMLGAGQSIARGSFIVYMCIHQSLSSHP